MAVRRRTLLKLQSPVRRSGRAAHKKTQVRPFVEQLEERVLLATIDVNSNADIIDPFDDACTLREAVIAANTDLASGPSASECVAGSGADTINVPAGTYTLNDPLFLGELSITDDVTIQGVGGTATIDGNATDRVFHITTGTVEFVGVKITNGRADTGGGIRNEATGVLTLTNTVVELNFATVAGGGIYNDSGTLTVTDSDINGNTASGFSVIAYKFNSTAFEAIDLVLGAPGVTSILTNVDNDSVDVDLGGDTFNFYGTVFTGASSLFVSSNALITFGSGNAEFSNTDLTTSPIEGAIAPFWDDLFTGAKAADQVLYTFEDTDADLVNDRLVIEWNEINPCCSASPSPATFQAILQLNTGPTPGNIVFNYPDVVFGTSNDNGASATVGIKNEGVQGPQRVLVSFNSTTPFVGDGLAILFTGGPVIVGGDGGGIWNSGSLDVTDSFIENNDATLSDGGGVYNDVGGTATITNSTIRDNTAFDRGGGIHAENSTVTITNSTISDNTADDFGGGIDADSSTVTIDRSTISGNDAGVAGGGIDAENSTVTITNSTISDNTADDFGGGINVEGGTVDLTNVTLNLNSSVDGGGIFNSDPSGTVTLVNTIVANSPTGGNFAGGGTFTSLGHNLSSDSTGAAFLTATGDLNDTDPLLGPLDDNGGPTETHALLAGSPAIDAADNAFCPATDQRGVPRPQGPFCDIGAFEAFATDLSVSKSDSPDPVLAGTDLTYTIRVDNLGPSDNDGFTLTDTIPARTSFVSATSPDCVNASGTVTCTSAGLASGGSVTWMITVHVASNVADGTTLSNTADIATNTTNDPVSGNNSDTETTTVNRAADLQVTKSDNPDPVIAGTNLTYTITATNNGPSDSQAVQIADVTPANTTFVSATPSAGGSCTTPAVGGTGTVTCTWAGATIPGAMRTLTLVVDVNADAANGSTITDTATTSSSTSDPNAANDSATAATTVNTGADLSITKSDAPDPVLAGNDLTYTLTTMNNGPSDAQDVQIVDATPANTTFVSATPSARGSCTTPAVGGTGTVTCTWAGATIPGATRTVTLVVNVNANTANGSTLSDTATTSSLTTDPDAANDSATATTTVNTEADLSITKADSPDPVIAGTNLTYTLTTTNNGSSDAQDVQIVDTSPANTTFVSATASAGGTCTTPAVGGTGTVTCTWAGATVPADTRSLTLVVNVDANTPAGSIISNTATTTNNTTDPNAANNLDMATTQVVFSATMSGRKFDDVNGDGSGAGDTGQGGVTIQLVQDANGNGISDDAVFASTMTAAGTGDYTFTVMQAGTYFLQEVVPANSTQTAPAAPGFYTVVATSGATFADRDFGNFLNFTISGRKFNDLDGDGTDDGGTDPGQGNVTIFLDLDNSGTLNAGDVSTTTAAGTGAYSFPNLGPRAAGYVVREVVPANSTQTAPAGGQYTVTASSGVNVTGRDFGNFAWVTIVGRKFNDLNSDGNGNGDPGLGGLTIQLVRDANNNGLNDDAVFASTVSAAGTGAYVFTVMQSGTFFVQEIVPAGSTQTAPPPPGFFTVVATSGATFAGRDFGNRATLDFGDAPDGVGPIPNTYPTLLINDGARHFIGGPQLGAIEDADGDGQPDATATGDDLNGLDDEDGVVLPVALVALLDAAAIVTASAAGKLDAWIDFNRNGVWEPSEQIAKSLDVVGGANRITFPVPATAAAGPTFARFRLSTAGGLAPTGVAQDGEVEDYAVRVDVLPECGAAVIDDPANPGQKALVVIDCPGGNRILFKGANRGTLVNVSINKRRFGPFDATQIDRIVAFGLAANDVISVDRKLTIDTLLQGGDGDDAIHGGGGNDSIDGGAGDDSILGDAGADIITGGGGNDTVCGGDGDDDLNGNDGNDSVNGGKGNDTMRGGLGDDIMLGCDGNDMIFGDEGDDSMNGGAGTDFLDAGLDFDLILFDLLDPPVVLGGIGNDGGKAVRI